MRRNDGVPSVRPADETKQQLALCIAKICRTALDDGDERETLERLAEMCEAVGVTKANGKTQLNDAELLHLYAGRIVAALKLDDKLTAGQLAAAVQREEGR